MCLKLASQHSYDTNTTRQCKLLLSRSNAYFERFRVHQRSLPTIHTDVDILFCTTTSDGTDIARLVDRHNETIAHFALLCCCRFGRCRLVPVATLFPMSSLNTSNRERGAARSVQAFNSAVSTSITLEAEYCRFAPAAMLFPISLHKNSEG